MVPRGAVEVEPPTGHGESPNLLGWPLAEADERCGRSGAQAGRCGRDQSSAELSMDCGKRSQEMNGAHLIPHPPVG